MGIDTSGLAAKRLELEQVKPVKEKSGSMNDRVTTPNSGDAVESTKDKPQRDDRHQDADQGIFEELGVITAGQGTDNSDEPDSGGPLLDVKV